MKIAVFYDPPPIPSRNCDYRAYDVDNYEPGMPIGYGATEEEALADLQDRLAEAEDSASADCERSSDPDGECFRGTEAAAYEAEQQAKIQRELK